MIRSANAVGKFQQDHDNALRSGRLADAELALLRCANAELDLQDARRRVEQGSAIVRHLHTAQAAAEMNEALDVVVEAATTVLEDRSERVNPETVAKLMADVRSLATSSSLPVDRPTAAQRADAARRAVMGQSGVASGTAKLQQQPHSLAR